MPDVNAVYQSQFLNAAQLNGQSRCVTIEGATVEVIGQGERAQQKIILQFHKVKPRLPLNKTNATFIASVWGPATENWIGHVVELKPTKVLFQGSFVDAIRIDQPGDAAPVAAAAAPAPMPSAPAESPNPVSEIENDIPW